MHNGGQRESMERNRIRVQHDGALLIPADIASRFGFRAGDELTFVPGENFLHIRRSVSHLARVNIELTNQCNLSCRTCIRHVWDEPAGIMDEEIFGRILRSIRPLEQMPMMFFGGFGEPLSHPRVLEYVQRAHDSGCRTELITNGILLSKDTLDGLCEAGLDFLWVSIDGASPESYADVRQGDALPLVLDNLKELRRLRFFGHKRIPELGIAFVAMKRNIKDLPEVVKIGIRLGAKKFSISNVLAYNEELKNEMLYMQALSNSDKKICDIYMPRIDATDGVMEGFSKLFRMFEWTDFASGDSPGRVSSCPFILKGSTSVRWDGKVSPCLPLLHSYDSYLGPLVRRSQEYFVGSLKSCDLLDLWSSQDYRAFRERVMEFDFAPCSLCSSCELAEKNLEDCFGNVHPACGGCLWAHGLIQCP